MNEPLIFYSSSFVIVSILTTFTSSDVLINVTPCVALPRTLISFTFYLIIVPLFVISITSSVSSAILTPTIFPVLGVILYVITPFPPLC